jgi:hypothetical protein
LLRCQLQYSLTVFKYGSVRASLAPCTLLKHTSRFLDGH